MAIDINIEDGSGKTSADCYGEVDVTTTLTNARSYAAARGVTLPSDDDAVKVMLVLGTDFIESRKQWFVGKPASIDQIFSWPRQCVRNADGNSYFPSNALPIQLIKALYQTCIEQQNGIKLQPSVDRFSSGGFLTHKKIAELEWTWSERIGTTTDPLLPKVNMLLADISYAGPGNGLQVIRA